MNRSTRADTICLALLGLTGTIVFLTAPMRGDYWWSEAPRNALDGAFILDLLRAMPIHDPHGWAVAYYLQYPALTILFYPPLLHVALAISYAIFGITHVAAIATVAAFYLGLLCAAYILGRRVAPPAAALAGAVLLASSPELLRWGQQVMLDVPAIALAAWAVHFLMRYSDTDRARDLAWYAVLAVAALYTKQTIVFPLAGASAGWLIGRGAAPLRRPHLWLVAGLAALALVPLAYLQVHFGSFNTMSVVDRPDVAGPSRWALAGFTWYLARFPGMFWWPMIGLAAVGVVAGLRNGWRQPGLIWGGWFALTYLALSMISLKEPRHALPLALPLALAATGGIAVILDVLSSVRPAMYAAVMLAFALFGVSLASAPTPAVTGVRAAAEEVVGRIPTSGRVLFAGNKDGSFIFNVRVLDPDRRITVVRADKLFLQILVMPSLGLHPRSFGREEIGSMLNRYGIDYVVTVPNVWSEAPVMANFAAVLASDQFELVQRIPMTGASEEKELVIYRNRGKLAAPPASLQAELAAGMAGGAAGMNEH